MASAAKETLRLASDLRRASRLSRSSLSLAAACCSSSVRTAILDPLDSASGWLDVDAPADFLCAFDFSGGISGRGEIVGLRIERGILVGAARDYVRVQQLSERPLREEPFPYRAPVAIPLPERIQPAGTDALAP